MRLPVYVVVHPGTFHNRRSLTKKRKTYKLWTQRSFYRPDLETETQCRPISSLIGFRSQARRESPALTSSKPSRENLDHARTSEQVRSKMASNSAQNLIHFNEIATAYNSLSKASGNGPRGLQVNDSKLTLVTLKARDVTWNPSEMTPETTRIGRTRIADRGEDSHTTDRTLQEDAAVQIRSGLCRGLNTKVKLPYPGVGDDSRVLLVDPCDERQREKHSTPMQLTSESQALVVEEALERQIYDGSFECKVYAGGSILTKAQRGGEQIFGQAKTQNVIAELRGIHHYAVKEFKASAL
ncbi:hypothetical protein RRG08_061416 [Elysia crispata]|uniref:Uncharacterized protein n=1 Tax=Elysia crispata TaxID=231223 RepID=A0AAE1CTB1_9GAST|nr:hypothetical protein RRG08_061416 [Elysia crispata]